MKKLKILAILMACAWLPASAIAEPVALKDFDLAKRIADGVSAGEEIDVLVSYHDVSNEFAPFIRAGVERADAQDGIKAFHRSGRR